MFSAAKLVVAGAIVALFGGLLLAGVLMQSSDEMAPAAEADSPTPTTTEELLSGMVTEEIEPGVYRVVNDGFRDLATVADGFHWRELAVGMDGSIWTWSDPDHELLRLGDPTSYPVDGLSPDLGIQDLRFGAGGVPWVGGSTGIYRLDGDAWTKLRTQPARLDISADGTVWMAGLRGSFGRSVGVGRLTPSGWEDHPVDLDFIAEALGLDPGVISWVYPTEFRAAPDGSVWVGLGVSFNQPVELGDGLGLLLLRFDGQEWAVVDPSGAGRRGHISNFDIGADGTAWVYLASPPQLARSSGGEWTVYTSDDGVTAIGPSGDGGYMKVDQAGTLWAGEWKGLGGCGGLRSFDGSRWHRYLEDVCVIDLDFAPDGSVWVTGAKDPPRPGPGPETGDTYRIDPALAGAGAGSP